MENGAEEDGVEMRAVSIDSFPLSFDEEDEYVDESNGGKSRADDEDGEYGERTLSPRTVTKDNAPSLYRESVTRQNRLFGVSVFVLAGLFVTAYFLMGLSFSPNNIGIFGDETSMRGGSGERTGFLYSVVRIFLTSHHRLASCRLCITCLFCSVSLCANRRGRP